MEIEHKWLWDISLHTSCKECCQVWIFKENKWLENTGWRADDVLAVSGHHQPNGRLVNKWFHWLLYCLLHHFLPHLVVLSLFTILVQSNCERIVATLGCLSPSLYYVFLSLSATHIRHTCNVQWLTIFPLFINYSHFLKENGKYTQTELFVLLMKSFWIDLCCPNKDSDSVLLTIFSHFAANYLYSNMVTDQQWQHFFVYLGDHHKTDFYISVYYSNTANTFSNHEYFDKS